MPSEAVLTESTENNITEAYCILWWMVQKPGMTNVFSSHKKDVLKHNS